MKGHRKPCWTTKVKQPDYMKKHGDALVNNIEHAENYVNNWEKQKKTHHQNIWNDGNTMSHNKEHTTKLYETQWKVKIKQQRTHRHTLLNDREHTTKKTTDVALNNKEQTTKLYERPWKNNAKNRKHTTKNYMNKMEIRCYTTKNAQQSYMRDQGNFILNNKQPHNKTIWTTKKKDNVRQQKTHNKAWKHYAKQQRTGNKAI